MNKNPRLIALATSDWHVHKFRNFNDNNQRLNNCINAAKEIIIEAEHLKVPVLFTGDLVHNPKEVENETMSRLQHLFDLANRAEVRFYAISGNHDLSEKNTLDHISPTHLDSFTHFENFHKVDHTIYQEADFYIHGIPYLNSDKELAKALLNAGKKIKKGLNILMIHTDLPGAKTPEGIEVKDADHITMDMFAPWDLVLCGHIHMPQIISKKVYMLGPPIHQNFGDEGNSFGYWGVYDDMSMVFKPLLNYPKFIRGEDKQDGNYYVTPEVILVDEDVERGEFHLSQSRSKLASLYLKKQGIKSARKRRALIQILNETE